VAYKRLDAGDGGNCDQLGLYIKRHCYQLIAISLDCVSMSILSNRLQSAQIMYRWMSTVVSTVGSTMGLTVGSTVGSTWLCWAIDLSKAFDSSDERLYGYQPRGFNGLVMKRTRRFTDSFYRLR
jgi:hypothetical protein